MGVRVGLDRCGKSRPPPGFDPRTFQPVGSRYTDYATRPTRFVFSFSILRILYFCVVLGIVSPLYSAVSFIFLYRSTDRCHRLEKSIAVNKYHIICNYFMKIFHFLWNK